MTQPATTINGALCRLRNDGSLEYQPRVGAELKWAVWYRELNGAHFEFVWAETREAALEYGLRTFRCLTNDPLHPEYDKNGIAAGWSPEDLLKAKFWHGDLIATRNIARRFAAA